MRLFRRHKGDIYIRLPRGTCIHHKGIGTVIGKGVRLGECCDIYHCVTIGEQYGSKGGVPTIGNNCRIYPFSMICGGIRVGDNVVVGSFTKVDVDVPDNCVVVGCPCKILPDAVSGEYLEYIKELHT